MAITRLGHFIAKFEGSGVPEGEFGSDVEGTKPIFFDVGSNKRKMAKALRHCHKHMGDHATILHDEDGLPNWIKKHLKLQRIEAQGTWECHPANFYGWEAEKVVAVTVGDHIMELITRAKTNLSVILVGKDFEYEETKEYFQQAADKGLIEVVSL